MGRLSIEEIVRLSTKSLSSSRLLKPFLISGRLTKAYTVQFHSTSSLREREGLQLDRQVQRMTAISNTNVNDDAHLNSKPWANEPILSKTSYAFDLPKELLDSLKLRSIDIPTEAEEDDGHSRRRIGEENQATQSDSGCAICPKAPRFSNVAEKRTHLRSDWHRYNVALNKKGRNEDAIAQEAFNTIAEEVSSSGESDTEPEGEMNVRVPVDLVNTLLKRLQLARSAEGQPDITSDEEGEEQERGKNAVAREPHLWFYTPPSGTAKVIPQTQFGVIRQLFAENEVDHSINDWHSLALSRMQPGPLNSSLMQGAKRLKGASAAEEAASILNVVFYDAPNRRQDSDSEEESDYDEEEKEEGSTTLSNSLSTSRAPQPMRTWTILLMGGGDFAALVVALNPYEQMISKKKGTTERQLLVIARKQFHRYTTRRKQGGAQSAQDASGRFAKSAGAQLRRYGEQQLAEEIRELLDRPEWRNAIQSSERVWIRAGLRSARGVLWSWPSSGGAARESPLEEMRRKDLVQNLPIAVRKPTVGECLRCFAELTKVRIRHETEEEMQKRDETYKAQLQGTAQARQERRQKQKERLQREAEIKQAANIKKRTTIKRDPVEELRRERLIRLVDMLRKGRLSNALKHLEKYELDLLHPNGWQTDADANKNFDPDDVDESMELARQRINAELPQWWRFLDARQKGALLHGPADSIESQLSNLTIRNRFVPSTILHVAAEGGSESVVNHFLVERHCDPTVRIAPPPHSDAYDEDTDKQEIATKASEKANEIFPHRTAYDICPNRESRDVFRRLMATRSDLCKNWSGMEKGGARVPKALTEEMEEARNKEEQVRDKRQLMRDRIRKRQEEEASANAHTITEEDRVAAAANQKAKNDAEQQSLTSNTNRLGGSGSAPRALQKKIDESQGLTPEMRARIEREKRARAAEARLKGLQGK